MRESITIDDLTFRLRWSTRRRTIGITVRRDGELVVAAPAGCRLRRVEEAVRAKLPWVRRKLAEAAARPVPPPRLWVDGEVLHYLGSACPLCLEADGGAPVRLDHGRFLMDPAATAEGRRHMIAWYSERAAQLLPARVARYREQVGVVPASVQVKDLGRRWGTCHSDGRLRFHWQIVAFPPAIVDYIVVHELVHLRELNHSPRFWEGVESLLPDYRRRRTWLRDEAEGCTL